MADLTVPFGLKNSEIILIGDISKNERGKKCGCVCPACHAPLIARLGDERAHHFAHSGEGCDAEIAYLTGLYKLVEKYALTEPLLLPELRLYWKPDWTKITERNFQQRVFYSRKSETDRETTISKARSVKFVGADVVYKRKHPDALLLTHEEGRQLALRIKPPATVCKKLEIRPYQEFPTVELDASDIPSSELKTEQLFDMLRQRADIYRWIYNSKAETKLDKINKENDALVAEKKEKMKAFPERKRKEAAVRKEEQLRQRKIQENAHESYRSDAYKPYPPAIPPDDNSEELKAARAEVQGKFTQNEEPIYDSILKARWIQCTECGTIAPDYEFSEYGGLHHVNSGICKSCNRAKRE